MFKTNLSWIFCGVALATSISCAKEESKVRYEPDSGNAVVNINSENAKMEAAIARAQKELPQFIETLRKPPKGATQFMVKKFFDAAKGAQSEGMWVEVQSYEKGEFYGVLINEPLDVPNLKKGDSLKVKEADVIDWGYFSEVGDLVGGYTNKVVEEQLAK